MSWTHWNLSILFSFSFPSIVSTFIERNEARRIDDRSDDTGRFIEFDFDKFNVRQQPTNIPEIDEHEIRETDRTSKYGTREKPFDLFFFVFDARKRFESNDFCF